MTPRGDIVSLYRARLREEEGAVFKDWGGKVSVALTYPNHYRLGMSNLGFQRVYALLNHHPHVVAERAFLPEPEEMGLYLRSGRPLLSLESQKPLREFNIIAFSLSFENDFPHVLQILDLGLIPPAAEERRGEMPLVMAGGIAAFLNTEPLASFMDLFLLGEAEAGLDPFLDAFLELHGSDTPREELLLSLAASVPGVYVPRFYRPEYHRDGRLKAFVPIRERIPERVRVPRPSAGALRDRVPVSAITTPHTEFRNKTLVEVGRGCGHSCRFCAAGYVYRPPRGYDPWELSSAVQRAVDRTGQVGLVSPAVSDVPGIEELTHMILARGGTFSVSSLRAETLTDGLLNHLKSAGQKTITIAPEAGSERLRKTINKHLSTDRILDVVRRIARTGDFSIRLYFMIGLPTETDLDLTEMVDLVKAIRHHMIKESAPRGSIGRIRLSLSCFVPKPFTPFQWFPMEDVGSLKRKQKWLKRALARAGGVEVGLDVPKWAYIQTLLSVGDRRVGTILHLAHRSRRDWGHALKHSSMNPDFYVYRPKGIDERLPWDFIDNGIRKGYLVKEYGLALKGEESEICHVGTCFRCGVCAGGEPGP